MQKTYISAMKGKILLVIALVLIAATAHAQTSIAVNAHPECTISAGQIIICLEQELQYEYEAEGEVLNDISDLVSGTDYDVVIYNVTRDETREMIFSVNELGDGDFTVESPAEVCGDGICEGEESCSNCESDCGECPPVCGNGICDAEEDSSACPGDCGKLNPDNVRDIYNWDAMHGLTLDDLQWKEISRETLDSGVTRIYGEWSAGKFTTLNSDGEFQTIYLSEVAEIYLPSGIGSMPEVKGLVRAMHVEVLVLRNAGDFSAEIIAEELDVAALLHGEMAKDWESLGHAGRGSITGAGFEVAMMLNFCEVNDLVKSNFGLALAKTNVYAITLLDRILEQEGSDLEDVALRGGSKEGYATWIASAVDPRIKIAMPGHFQLQDITGFNAYEENSGCEGYGAGAASIQDLMAFRNWMLESPAGQKYSQIYQVSNFTDLIYSNDLYILGDVGLFGMHDGRSFTPGAETYFLENFDERNWRYERWEGTDLGGDQSKMSERRTGILAWGLVNGLTFSDVPKITSTDVEIQGNQFRVTATTSPEASAAKLWVASSPDRAFDDGTPSEWRDASMNWNGSQWISNWISAPVGEMAGWYVEVDGDKINIGGYNLDRRDASPMKFIFELPKLSCPAPHPDCE